MFEQEITPLPSKYLNFHYLHHRHDVASLFSLDFLIALVILETDILPRVSDMWSEYDLNLLYNTP